MGWDEVGWMFKPTNKWSMTDLSIWGYGALNNQCLMWGVDAVYNCFVNVWQICVRRLFLLKRLCTPFTKHRRQLNHPSGSFFFSRWSWDSSMAWVLSLKSWSGALLGHTWTYLDCSQAMLWWLSPSVSTLIWVAPIFWLGRASMELCFRWPIVGSCSLAAMET